MGPTVETLLRITAIAMVWVVGIASMGCTGDVGSQTATTVSSQRATHMTCERVEDAQQAWESETAPDSRQVATIAEDLRAEASLASDGDLARALSIAADFFQGTLDPKASVDRHLNASAVARRRRSLTRRHFESICGRIDLVIWRDHLVALFVRLWARDASSGTCQGF